MFTLEPRDAGEDSETCPGKPGSRYLWPFHDSKFTWHGPLTTKLFPVTSLKKRFIVVVRSPIQFSIDAYNPQIWNKGVTFVCSKYTGMPKPLIIPDHSHSGFKSRAHTVVYKKDASLVKLICYIYRHWIWFLRAQAACYGEKQKFKKNEWCIFNERKTGGIQISLGLSTVSLEFPVYEREYH